MNYIDKIKQHPPLVAILLLLIATALTVIFIDTPYHPTKELTPEQKMVRYAEEHSCNRTKLVGITWWQCANGWWEEIELYDLANGLYHVDGSKPLVGHDKPQEKVDNGSSTEG